MAKPAAVQGGLGKKPSASKVSMHTKESSMLERIFKPKVTAADAGSISGQLDRALHDLGRAYEPLRSMAGSWGNMTGAMNRVQTAKEAVVGPNVNARSRDAKALVTALMALKSTIPVQDDLAEYTKKSVEHFEGALMDTVKKANSYEKTLARLESRGRSAA